MKTTTIKIAGIDLEVFEAGEGAPLLWLHGSQGFNPKQEFVPLFSARRRLIVPSHPGFGRSGLPDWLDSIDDIAHIYLELMDTLGLDKVDLVGCSIGGWIAAEMATKAPERVSRLVMVGPVGVKVGSADKLDIPDIFAMPQADVNKLVYHDPVQGARHRQDAGRRTGDHVPQSRDPGAAGVGAVDAQHQTQAPPASREGAGACSFAAPATVSCPPTI